MVELIVVMSIMGILAAVAMPRLTDRNALRERGFRDQLKGMLDHARKLAMVQQRDVCVLITPAQASAVYTTAAGCAPALPVQEPSASNAFVIPVPSGVPVAGVAQVRFNARGQPVPNANQVVLVGVFALNISRETGIVQ